MNTKQNAPELQIITNSDELGPMSLEGWKLREVVTTSSITTGSREEKDDAGYSGAMLYFSVPFVVSNVRYIMERDAESSVGKAWAEVKQRTEETAKANQLKKEAIDKFYGLEEKNKRLEGSVSLQRGFVEEAEKREQTQREQKEQAEKQGRKFEGALARAKTFFGNKAWAEFVADDKQQEPSKSS